MIIHTKIHPSNISASKERNTNQNLNERTTNRNHRKPKRRKNRRIKVVPSFEFDEFHKTKVKLICFIIYMFFLNL